jgi:AcrR family transcriptional regulator
MRERLVETVSRLVNAYGVAGFTLDDVASELGISKKTIYKHAAGKEELVSAYLEASLKDNMDRTKAAIAAASGFAARFDAALRSYHRYRIPTSTLEGIRRSYPESWQLIEEQRRAKLALVHGLAEEARRSGELRPDVDLDFLVLLLDRFTAALLEGDYLTGRGLGVNEAFEEIEKVLLGGILARGPVPGRPKATAKAHNAKKPPNAPPEGGARRPPRARGEESRGSGRARRGR